jgi:hypothetical protein
MNRRNYLALTIRSLRNVHGDKIVRHWWLKGKITSKPVPDNPIRSRVFVQ